MHQNPFIYPSDGLIGKLINRLLAYRVLMRLRRAILSRLPFIKLASDVRDVVYCTWVVPVAKVAHLLPNGVLLSQHNGYTLFTILTYKHGHFGAAFLGPLRRLMPSPLQSNWRLYVDVLPGNKPADKTVLFVKNIFDQALFAIGTRLFTDVLPSHLAASFSHQRQGGRVNATISAGKGSAPAFQCMATETMDRDLPVAFHPFFDCWQNTVTSLCLQDAAIARVEDCERIAYSAIDLPIDIATVVPLAAQPSPQQGDFLRGIGASGTPFCFLVPQVPFRVLSERLL